MRLLHIYDNKQYVDNNCYQHQLYKVLKNSEFKYQDVSLGKIDNFDLKNYDIIFSSVRLRNYKSVISLLSKKIKNKKFFVYDQYPWENYIDHCSCKDYYQMLKNNFNINFINTSKWWTDYNNNNGYITHFSRMWVLPEYCNYGIPWKKRKYEICFIGTLHEHRKKFFSMLKNKYDLNVLFRSGLGYLEYLNALRDVKFFINEEKDHWKIKGESIGCNSMWIKQVEIAAQGCISIRNHEEEYHNYDLGKIPSIISYQNVDEIKDIICLMDENNDHGMKSVDEIKKNNHWNDIIKVLKT